MKEQQPAAFPQDSPGAGTQYKDRRTWLVLFGVVELLIAAFFGLMAALMMAVPRLTGNSSPPPGLPHGFWFVLAATYLLIGLLFVAGGIGSMLAKNWARLLMLVLSWTWLIFGIFGAIGQIFFIVLGRNFQPTQVQNQNITPEFLHVVQIFSSIFIFIVFVLVPLTFIIFYTRKSVKATCRRTMPIVQREQTVPVAIWVLVGLLSLHALGLLSTAMLFPALGLFGFFVTGWTARAILIVLTVVWSWLAWNCYRRDLRAWWIALGLSVFFGLSNLVTNVRHTVDDIYRVINFPKPPMTALAALFTSTTFRVGFGALVLLVYVGFLIYTKRHFPQPVETNPAPAPN